MAAFTLVAGTRIRETAALRGAAVEMRELVREATVDAQRRDQRAAEQQDRLTRFTKWLVLLAAVTLAAAIVGTYSSVSCRQGCWGGLGYHRPFGVTQCRA